MSNSRSSSAYPLGQAIRRSVFALTLAAAFGAPFTAKAVTMPLHLADNSAERGLDSAELVPPQPSTLGLGVDASVLGTPDGGPGATPIVAVPPDSLASSSKAPMPSLSAFPGQVGRDFVHLVTRPFSFDGHDWTRLALGTATVGAVALLDDRVHASVQAHRTPGSNAFARRVRPIGTWGGVAVMSVTLAVGELFHEPELAATGLDGIEASLFTGVIVAPALKKITGRERPNAGEGPSDFGFFSTDQSFPSGEVTMAFTNAAVISQHTDSVALRSIAWGLASLVGWERIQLDAHWASDVVAGALIGSAVGSWVAAIHKPDETRSHTTVSVLPLVGPRTLGVTASISW